MTSLGHALPAEIARVEAIAEGYRALPPASQGGLRLVIEPALARARAANGSQEIEPMLTALKDLREIAR